ncbi:MAG: L-lactate dehydrogenase [Candidatus Magasanikbacteria bacterium]|jgi:L-lactate dehydrogenase|nr:L-lactate dehydrogenase [Candidatus Magasanikbacteria bacterium]MBT4220671.1 L-lactate dehydrogenase [Candidatus Magasanikbacteria bacterium]MBT4350381.1 L-lactate dehydrogenase [Candidatus Magasanikbacteria bacterium]MBT4541831.1 L-lactate dehydrogenase [Candidatus Magasanikbacteria bacterium]MBT6252759.1 L-lactate dehydrogenase [Candidatus Magasanikbacteria bacterium]
MRSPSGTTIAIIGAGAVGATIAYTAAIKHLASKIILVDIDKQKEAGEVMDMCDGLCFMDTGIISGGTYKEAKAADIIVIAAGVTQKQQGADSRLDLIEKNKGILKSILKSIGRLKKDTILLIVSNPVDILTHLAVRFTNLPTSQIIGTGTLLDTARMREAVASHLHVHPQNVHGYVLGEHGNSSVIVWSSVTVGGIPIKQIPSFTTHIKKQIEQSVKKRAHAIIKRKGVTCYGVTLATMTLLEAIIYNQHKTLSISTTIRSWNGVSHVALGVPAVIGRAGVERIWPLTLSSLEKKAFHKSASLLIHYL